MTSSAITVGEIRESQAVAIGAGARASLNQYTEIIVKVDSIEALPPAPGPPPYKGLAYFTEKDADIFYGREALSNHLAIRLGQTHFLALIGASGSGKSSLLRAGIIPCLRRQEWLVHLMTPGGHPLASLANSLGRDVPALEFAPKLQQMLAADPQLLHLLAGKLAARAGSTKVLLAVDQFEELFSQCRDESERSAFVDTLLAAAEAQGAATVLVGLRADFYDRCARYAGLRDLVSRQQAFIGSLAQDELVRAIAEPARRGGWQFVEGLVEQMLEDVGQEPGRLPLLSHALLETWQRRRGVVMTLGGYRDAGGVEGAIAKTAEDTLQCFDAAQTAVAQHIFLSLTELGEGAEDTRRIATRDELAQNGGNAALFDGVLQSLVAARLVTAGEGQVQVAHEALIRRWPRLHNWLAENRERLRFERQLAQDAQDWQRLGRDPGALYRGARLQQAIEWTESQAISPAGLPATFLAASRALAERQAQEKEAARRRELKMAQDLAQSQSQAARRLRWAVLALGGVIVAMFVIIGILVAPFVQEVWARSQAEGEMVHIPAGIFIFGSQHESFVVGEDEFPFWPQEARNVAEFWLDKYEVTNRQYRLCVKYGDCSLPVGKGIGWEDGNDEQEYPVVNVTWTQAAGYCQWLGKRLPTEVEWERAVRGADRLNWPWGNEEPGATRVNMPLDGEVDESGRAEPVDSRPAGVSAEGAHHLIGNVWEWTSSYWHWDETTEEYDEYNEAVAPEISFGSDDYFVMRGGGWYSGVEEVAEWLPFMPGGNDDETGMRCASSRRP